MNNGELFLANSVFSLWNSPTKVDYCDYTESNDVVFVVDNTKFCHVMLTKFGLRYVSVGNRDMNLKQL